MMYEVVPGKGWYPHEQYEEILAYPSLAEANAFVDDWVLRKDHWALVLHDGKVIDRKSSSH